MRDVVVEVVAGVDILGVVVKAVAEVAVRRRVAMVAVFMVTVVFVTCLEGIVKSEVLRCFFEVVDLMRSWWRSLFLRHL